MLGTLLLAIVQALGETGRMFWGVLWSLILGFSLSAA